MDKFKNIVFNCYEKNIILCLYINKRVKNSFVKKLILFLCSPYIIISWLLKTLYELTFGKIIISFKLKKEEKQKFDDELAIVAIAKNEAQYIKEWVVYHLLAGASKIYIYDNESEDDLKSQLEYFIDEGSVIYKYYPGKNKQMDVYNDAIANYNKKTHYMAFIDCDEFLVAENCENLSNLIKNLIGKVPNAGGLGVNWALYGSSGYERKQKGLVTEIFLNRAKNFAWQNFHVKTIANPRLIKNYISPHFPLYKLGTWSIDSKGKRQRLWYNHNVDFSVIRLNHYFCKSREEFMEKRSRGMADRQAKYDFSKFDEYDLNDIYDDIMLRYVNSIKQIIEFRS